MIFPPFLRKGDRVAVISPAGKISDTLLDCAVRRLTDAGFVPLLGQSAAARNGIFAGSDQQRSADLQWAIDDQSVKAIFFSRGGYGSLRTALLTNWSKFLAHPKWLVGFSDITVFHSLTIVNHIASLHGVMSAFFEKDGAPTASFVQTIGILMGQNPAVELTPHPFNRNGIAEGMLAGGNLSIIQSLRGTPFDVHPEGKILFIEDIGEYHYHIDRMMMNLKGGGYLQNLRGLVVGYFSDSKDGETPFGMNAFEIIRDIVDPYDFPVLFSFPAGHELPNFPLVMGGGYALQVSDKEVKFQLKSW